MAIRPGIRLLGLSVIVVAVPGSGILAQAPAGPPTPAQQKPVVRSVAAPPIASVEGEDNFKAYCAVCHGPDGRGDGPAAPAMKAPVPDLTQLAKRHGGKFDPLTVEQVIRGTDRKMTTPAHGVESMPIWGDVFRANGSLDPAVTTVRVRNLVKYLQGMQR
jgi:mono/diheme cytochrome c family protein